MYDPGANTWTLLAPMNVGRNHCAGGTIGGRFYVVGGRAFADSDVALEVYDPVANSWTSRMPMPTGRSGIGAGVVNNRLYVFGGEMPSLHNEVESYDPVSNTWQQLSPMPTPKHGIWASVSGTLFTCRVALLPRVWARPRARSRSPFADEHGAGVLHHQRHLHDTILSLVDR